MKTKELSKDQEVEYNISKALIIIESDRDLDEMFRDKFGTEYAMCHAMINSSDGTNNLKPKAQNFIKELFDKIIVERSELLEKYKKLKLNKPKVVKPVEETNKASTSLLKKRWGLKAIASDIAEFFGGKSKQIHRTGQKVQDLKKLFCRLEIRMFNERFSKETLSESELREISGAIETFNKKVNSILKAKK
jgi:hypothetical protein